MPSVRKIFVVEKGQLAIVRDNNGNEVSFESLAELSRCTGMDFSGKFYVGYEPTIGFFQDSEDPFVTAGDIPHTGYEWLIDNIALLAARKADPLYGLTGVQLFEAQKRVDEAEVRRVYAEESEAPVECLDLLWNGGQDSASYIQGAVVLAQALAEEMVTITDIDNVAHTMSFTDALTVAAYVGAQFRDAFLKKQAGLVEIANRVME